MAPPSLVHKIHLIEVTYEWLLYNGGLSFEFNSRVVVRHSRTFYYSQSHTVRGIVFVELAGYVKNRGLV